jgi:hypothetical protein
MVSRFMRSTSDHDVYSFLSTYSTSHPIIVTVVKDAADVLKYYIEAIERSVMVAGHGIAFAAEVSSLCEHLSQASGPDVRLFIDEMGRTVELAHGGAQDTFVKFVAVREKLMQVWVWNTPDAVVIR